MENFCKSTLTRKSGEIIALKIGFTLIEVMSVLAVVSILLLAAQRPLLEFHRLAFEQQQKILLQGDFQRFLMMIKTELIQAGYAQNSGNWKAVEISEHSLVLKADRNNDGDLSDTRENIAYRYDPETQILSRKSGNAAYQTLIEGLATLSFEQLQSPPPPPVCVKITVQVLEKIPEQESVLCRFRR